mmetsp:Transcript_43205/g.101604  ORF Transcript_43205/g.101604 Transcript_43205/m.101604 type:complete len:379 (+) Transcript_43205:103-1239(+)|eukprot:CAMPEP_0178403570 /NCGR_PEP_ID=MMETSP0689_2-20121128/17437_1 /TAXON_ID=160604 /ORGANISM="Amphidinium massartii, Strain CS-259" /LENGTH=378 /DNA_ID=CAMNT_0020024529 /DNA_START=103 /DNA_END=1239 /DNA_ORIENTATION=-
MSGQPDFNSDDFYKVLGLSKGASEAEISKAYKKLALKHHPDKNPNDKEAAEQRFKKISEAYSVLSDPEKKKIYDQVGKQGLYGGAPSAGGAAASGFGGNGGVYTSGASFSSEDAENIFRMFFGGSGGPMGMSMNMSSGGAMPSGSRMMFMSQGGGRGNGGNPFFEVSSDEESADFPMHGMPFSFGGMGGGGLFGGQDIFSQMQGGGRGVKRARGQQPYAIAPGTPVVVHGLSKAAHHNGKAGKVLKFDEQRMRYDVSVDGEAIALRPQNLTQRVQVEISGLLQKPELNGKTAEIFQYQEETDRYRLLVGAPSDSQAVALHPSNCILKVGTCVTMRNLANNKYNGDLAVIVSLDRAAGRYRVRTRRGEEIAVKFDKVLC